MIKILVINTVRFKLNGISAVIKNYYLAMNKKDLKMEFIAIDEPSSEYNAFFKENNLVCHVINKRNMLNYILQIIKICRKEKYDVVHVHGNSANMAVELLACMIGGVKVRIAHSHNTSTLHPLTHKLLWPLFSQLCTVRLACGEDAGRWLFRDLPFVVLKNGIDVKRYKFDEEIRKKYRKKVGVESDEFLLGHVGNFIEQKNHNFLIEIFSELHKVNSKIKSLLVSDGMLMPIIQEKVRLLKLDNSVVFLGKTMEVEKYFQAMDVFVLRSLLEGLPLVLVEAQSSGLVCVVSDTVSKEADLTGTSVFLSLNSLDSWKNELRELSSTTFDRKSVSAENLKKIRNAGYDIVQNADKLRQIYVNSCGGKINDV